MAVDDFDDGYDASDYNTDDLADAYQAGMESYNANQNQQAGMGSGAGIDSFSGNAGDFTIGIDSKLNNMSDDMFTNYMNAGSNRKFDGTLIDNVFDLGGGVGDFGFGTGQSPYATVGNQFSSGGPRTVPTFLNPTLAEMYKKQEADRTGVNLDKNPYVDSMFTDLAKLFGTEIDRTKDLGSNRIQEINDLRARQAFGLPSLTQYDADGNAKSYTAKDFEIGRNTQQGMVKELPMGGIESFIRMFMPGGFLLPTSGAPEHSQMYRDAQAEASAPGIMSQAAEKAGDYISEMGNLFTGAFSAKPKIKPFDQFSNTRDRFMNDTRQIEDFEERVDIPDFRTDPNVDDFRGVGNFPIIDSVKVNREELGSMNPDGQYGDAAGSLFKRTTENSPNYIDDYTSPNFTQAEIEKKYNEMFGVETPTKVEASIPKTINSKSKSESIYPPGTTSDDLERAAQAYLSQSREEQMKMDFPTFYSKGARTVSTTPNFSRPGFSSSSMSKDQAQKVIDSLNKVNPIYTSLNK